MKPSERLAKLNACSEAVTWVGDKEVSEAWTTCHRADWMLWLAAKVCYRRQVVLAACACARTSSHRTTDPRALKAIETAEAWTRGEVTLEEVRVAAAVAYDAYVCAGAADAADAAAYDADTATYAAAYAACAADAAYTATYAAACAADAADAAARQKALSHMADLVRGIISVEEITGALEGYETK